MWRSIPERGTVGFQWELSSLAAQVSLSIREAIEIQRQGPALNRVSGYEPLAVFLEILSRDSHHLKSRDKNYFSVLDKDSAKESNACTLKCIFIFWKLTCLLAKLLSIAFSSFEKEELVPDCPYV